MKFDQSRKLIAAVLIPLASSMSCSSAPPVEEAAAPAAPSVREDRRPEIEACTDAMRRAEQLPAGERVTEIVETCKNLWLDPGCRAAWSQALSEPPETRAESVIQGCAAAACPRLENPVALCRHDLSQVDLLDESPDWAGLWKELNQVVLARDLGLSPQDALGAILAMRLLQLVAISGSAPHEGNP